MSPIGNDLYRGTISMPALFGNSIPFNSAIIGYQVVVQQSDGDGYDTNARVLQTANNLGITAEGASRPIKRIELIANQETLFQIYLFELTSVTISHTRSLARTFRNRAGNYLLILTNDYEDLDFVLREKYLPGNQRDAVGIAMKQVAHSPRILTVERRKPGRVHLIVL